LKTKLNQIESSVERFGAKTQKSYRKNKQKEKNPT